MNRVSQCLLCHHLDPIILDSGGVARIVILEKQLTWRGVFKTNIITVVHGAGSFYIAVETIKTNIL
jgi:hypothetical protein